MNNMNEVKSPKKPVLMYYVIIFLLVILFQLRGHACMA